MYKFKTLTVLLALVLASCEKVIDVDLNDASPQTVIEAKLKEGTSTFEVTVRKTTSYFEPTTQENIENAVVVLVHPVDGPIYLTYINNGIYSASVTAVADKSYILEVTIDNVVYEAVSYLPVAVPIVDLEIESEPAGPGPQQNQESFGLSCGFNDPVGIENFYRINHAINGELQNEGSDLNILDDGIFDGAQANYPLFQQSFHENDTVLVELVCFDQSSYKFFSSLANLVSGGQGPNGSEAAPGNPVNNWSNNALGYFSAFSSDTMSVIIQ